MNTSLGSRCYLMHLSCAALGGTNGWMFAPPGFPLMKEKGCLWMKQKERLWWLGLNHNQPVLFVKYRLSNQKRVPREADVHGFCAGKEAAAMGHLVGQQ